MDTKISLYDLLPSSLKTDVQISAMAKAIDIKLKETDASIENVIILPYIHKQPSEVIDALAWQLHVDFYNPELPLDVRRKIVAQSLEVHMVKGTGRAVEIMLEAVFGSGWIEEWFQYGGEPHFFRVISSSFDITNSRYEEFLEILETVKRKSSWLEYVMSKTVAPERQIPIYTIALGATRSTTTLREAPRPDAIETTIYFGGVYTRYSSRTLPEMVDRASLIDSTGAVVTDATGAVIEVKT